MKHSHIISAAAVLLGILALTGCEQKFQTYNGDDCVYFDVHWGVDWLEGKWAHQYYSTVSFGSIDGKDCTLSNIDIRVSGMPCDKDREVYIIANPDSTTLASGTEFDPIDGKYVIPAGSTKTTLSVTFHRTERMSSDTLLLQLKIKEADGLDISRFPDYDDENNTAYRTENAAFDYNHDAQVHNIFVYDTVVKPGGWWGTQSGGLWGLFSSKKWRLMMELTNTVVSDYASTSIMGSKRAQSIGTVVAEYLWSQVQKREPVIDEDGSMMWVNAVSTVAGTSAWTQGTKWEDYSKTH